MQTRNARKVTKALLRDIIIRYGMPLTIGSDNRPAIVAETAQEVASDLMTGWKLHTAYCLQN